ncbi:hypothetical protein GCM10023189_46620 [Nibrella saemangeumensis]|uniref:Uncharacterized protein n=1 Tax=Nibrella saemangeumensis TaxID=1084526 RepID=A0ABP8NHP4_9BACT
MKKLLILGWLLTVSLCGFAQEVNTTKQDIKATQPPRTTNHNRQAMEKARKKRQKASDARQAASDTLQQPRLRPDSLRRGGAMKVDTL